MKRGQLSIFMIIGVIAIILVLLYMASNLSDTEQIVTQRDQIPQIKDVNSVQEYTQGCVEKVAQDTVIHFGLVGANGFKTYFNYGGNYKVPYYFTNGVGSAPSIEDSQKIISAFFDSNLRLCTKGFPNAQGLQIQEGLPVSSVLIGDNAISFEVKFPLDVVKGDQRAHFEEFNYVLPGRFDAMITIANEIVAQAELDEITIQWDLLNAVTELGFDITAHAERDNTLIYRMVDPRTKVHNEPMVYQWAMKVRTEWPGQ